MITNKCYSVVLWISVLLLDLQVHGDLKNFNKITYIQNEDPDRHAEGLTYGRLTFLRGCLVQEQYLNREEKFDKKCKAHNYTRYYHHTPVSLIHQLLQCRGNIFNCIPVKNFAMVVTMHIDNQFYQLSVDKKNYFMAVEHFKNLSEIFKKKKALLNNSDSDKIYKCYCDDESEKKTVRSFCQDIVETDSLLGYVLTGVRLKIINRIVYLEVQQGKLINGSIDLNTVNWKKSQPCRYYGVLNYEYRALQLDNVFIPENYVITGVMWIRYHKQTDKIGLKGRLLLAIKGTRVDDSGNLVLEEWLIRDKISTPRRQLHAFSQYILSSPTNKSQELSIPNVHYIKFRTTSWAEDFAQHVVPFIDLREVVSNSSKPIIGVGVYYRSSYLYGGFVALKLMGKN